jgi:hypothetical protein
MRCHRRLAAAAIVASVAGAFPSLAAAQAFLPAKGDAYVSILFTNMYSNRHYLPVQEFDLGEIDANTLLFDATYGISDRMAISIGLPLVVSRYQGTRPHQPGNPNRLDDGDWHPTFQDVRVNFRYNAVRRGTFAVTPFVGTATPSHSYAHWAHAAPGTNLKQMNVGVTAASLLDKVTPGLFVQGRYSFAVAEHVAYVTPTRSNLDIELGYFVSPALRVFGLTAAQKSHSGIDVFPNLAQVAPEVQLQNHDRVSRDDFLHVGGGASFSLTERLDLFGAFLTQVAGRNGHKMNRAVSVGVTWNLRRANRGPGSAGGPPAPAPGADDAAPAKSLVRCLCQKG